MGCGLHECCVDVLWDVGEVGDFLASSVSKCWVVGTRSVVGVRKDSWLCLFNVNVSAVWVVLMEDSCVVGGVGGGVWWWWWCWWFNDFFPYRLLGRAIGAWGVVGGRKDSWFGSFVGDAVWVVSLVASCVVVVLDGPHKRWLVPIVASKLRARW
jgi:hypothetical protein